MFESKELKTELEPVAKEGECNNNDDVKEKDHDEREKRKDEKNEKNDDDHDEGGGGGGDKKKKPDENANDGAVVAMNTGPTKLMDLRVGDDLQDCEDVQWSDGRSAGDLSSIFSIFAPGLAFVARLLQ